MMADAFDKRIPDWWIDLHRCEQYVLCMRCGGVGLIVISAPLKDSVDPEKALRLSTEIVDKRLVEVLAMLPKARLAQIINEVRA